MSEEITTKFEEFLNISKQLRDFRKQQKELRQKLITLEKEIKDYMMENSMDSISLKGGEIILYEKKIAQTFKKESIVENLTKKLNNPEKAEELTEVILSNKTFVVQDKIKAVIKKSD